MNQLRSHVSQYAVEPHNSDEDAPQPSADQAPIPFSSRCLRSGRQAGQQTDSPRRQPAELRSGSAVDGRTAAPLTSAGDSPGGGAGPAGGGRVAAPPTGGRANGADSERAAVLPTAAEDPDDGGARTSPSSLPAGDDEPGGDRWARAERSLVASPTRAASGVARDVVRGEDRGVVERRYPERERRQPDRFGA